MTPFAELASHSAKVRPDFASDEERRRTAEQHAGEHRDRTVQNNTVGSICTSARRSSARGRSAMIERSLPCDTMPSTPAATASSTLSVSARRMSRARPAPSPMRTANSRRRDPRAHEQQVGDVRAGDEQECAHRGKEDLDRAALTAAEEVLRAHRASANRVPRRCRPETAAPPLGRVCNGVQLVRHRRRTRCQEEAIRTRSTCFQSAPEAKRRATASTVHRALVPTWES